MRARKFGVPLSEAAKKEVRAARFNISSNQNTTNNSSAASIKNAIVVRFKNLILFILFYFF